jgi:hypothetical protein
MSLPPPGGRPVPRSVTVVAPEGAWTPSIFEDVTKGTVLPFVTLTAATSPTTATYTFDDVAIVSARALPSPSAESPVTLSEPAPAAPRVSFTFDYRSVSLQRGL